MKKDVLSTPKPEEDIVDFVIDNRSKKKTIDLPQRTETHSVSPTKSTPSMSHAPGKLKLRWLQASKQQQDQLESSTTTPAPVSEPSARPHVL